MTTSEAGMDYRSTVQTPKTDFPQRGGLPKREPELLAKWEESALHDRIAEKRRNAKAFILHDGPPYANGNIHVGHALNKVLKDIIVRYKTMSGFRSPYVPGWDCHGLPIEQKVVDDLRKKKEGAKERIEIRRLCADYAHKWIDTQREEFKRLGVGGQWDKPYLTLDPSYEAAIVRAFAALVAKGYVFRGFKPVHWDWVFETALAEAEIEYNEQHVSHSIYLRFPLVSGKLPEVLRGVEKPTIVIWTTTPWTLPANLGVSVHPDFDYVAYKCGSETFIVAEGLLLSFKMATEKQDGEVVATFKGRELDRLECAHPCYSDKMSLVMCGGHVTLEAGTGCVHTAPAHGVEDFQIGEEYGLGVFNPVDERGCYNELYPDMQGTNVLKANELLVKKFQDEGTLVASGKLTHSYPYSWRSHKPVIMRATEQWFMDVGKNGLRDAAMKELNEVEWIPKWGYDRISSMVAGRPDWCLSRQRSWGVPIPAVRDREEGKSLLLQEVCDKFAELVEQEGTDCWYTRPVEDFLPDAMKADTGRYEKEYDILDVWFDSGASHLGVLKTRDDLLWPADLYLEGSDQHRGWFQSSLWVSMGVKDEAPYRAVLTHGFTLDGKGEAMSKSKGNVVAPQKVIEKLGADVLRLWVASEDYRGDVKVSDEILGQVGGVYRRVRNTIRFLLGNLVDFNPTLDTVALSEMAEDDRWALARLNELTTRVCKAYDSYEFHRVFHLVNEFCVTDLGAIYLDCAKDRLYCSAPDDTVRRACQTVVHEIATHLLRMLAPIAPFTTDEAWAYLPQTTEDTSVHLADFPAPNDAWNDAALLEKWERLLEWREMVQKAIEPLRAEKKIGNSLEARVVLRTANEKAASFLADNAELLPRLFIVSQVAVEKGDSDIVEIQIAAGGKCERCWTRSEWIGTDTDHPGLCERCAGAVRRMTT